MKTPGRIFASILITALLLFIISWPAPKYLTTGIPSNGAHPEYGGARTMIHGDHLQLMYRLWLGADYFTGGTPPLHNLYEFNTGDDAERKVFNAQHFPFPLMYKLGELMGGKAFGWNFTIFMSFWLGYIGSWLLLRRFGASDGLAACFALFAIIFPYKWLTIAGGSPSGFGMCWTPWVWLGVDMFFRDESLRKKVAGSTLAGVAILFIAFCDSHIFLFTLLYFPFLVIISFLQAGRLGNAEGKSWISTWSIASAPLALSLIASIGYGLLKKKVIHQAGGGRERTLKEVQLYSNNWREYFYSDGSHMFFGILFTIILVLASLFVLYCLLKKKLEARIRYTLAILLVGITASIFLAYGTEGPFGFAPIKWVRELVPMYDKIRQPSKIFIYMPLLATMFFGIIAAQFGKNPQRKEGVIMLSVMLFAIMITNYQHYANPAVCLLDTEQAAYAAVAEECESNKWDKRLMVVPLWPGDSAESSLYEHYVSLYRIKMINGYSPVNTDKYVEEIFLGFQSVNQGRLSNEQLDNLLSRGIRHIILHETLFPGKVSPRPASITLERLLTHERLSHIHNSEGAHAFRIEKTASLKPPSPSASDIHLFNRFREIESMAGNAEKLQLDSRSVSGATAARLSGPKSKIYFPQRNILPNPNLKWRVRCKGTGSFWAAVATGEQLISRKLYTIDHDEWDWIDLSLEWITYGGRYKVILAGNEGSIDFDCALLADGNKVKVNPGETIKLPANAAFYSEGISNFKDGSLLFTTSRTRGAADCWKALNLLLEPGDYEFELIFDSPSAENTHLGNAYVESNRSILSHQELHTGVPCKISVNVKETLPVNFKFHYLRQADITIKELIIRRKSSSVLFRPGSVQPESLNDSTRSRSGKGPLLRAF